MHSAMIPLLIFLVSCTLGRAPLNDIPHAYCGVCKQIRQIHGVRQVYHGSYHDWWDPVCVECLARDPALEMVLQPLNCHEEDLLIHGEVPAFWTTYQIQCDTPKPGTKKKKVLKRPVTKKKPALKRPSSSQ